MQRIISIILVLLAVIAIIAWATPTNSIQKSIERKAVDAKKFDPGWGEKK